MIRTNTALAVLLILSGIVGCGGGTAKVEGTVTLDGSPVEGAVVSFMPTDSKGTQATGTTDSSGKFTLSTAGKPGAKTGDYKVTVVKTKVAPGAADMKPGSPDYEKMMKQGAPGGIAGGKPGPSAMPPGPKSELPSVYASMTTTPFSQKVPPSGPITLALESKKQ